MALLSEDRLFGTRILQQDPYRTDTVVQPTPTTTTTSTPYGTDAVVRKLPTQPVTTDTPIAKPIPTAPASNTSWNINQFSTYINKDTVMPSAGKEWITSIATRAATGDADAIRDLTAFLPKMQMSPETRASLYAMLGIKAPTTTPTSGGGVSNSDGGGSGGGSGSGGSGGGDGGGSSSGGGVYGQANNLIAELMGGDFTSIPLWAELTDPARNNPYTNPAMQPIIDGIQREGSESILDEQRALMEMAEAGGRYGSGTYNHLRTRATEENSEAITDAISKLLGGAYESEQSRRAGLLGAAMDAMLGGAGLAFSDKASQRQASAASAANRLARQQFNFSKRMQLASAQQDALSDYLGTILGIGSLGGTTTNTASGAGIPAGMDENTAALLGLLGGYAQSQGGFSGWGGAGFGTNNPQPLDASGDLAVEGMM